MKTKGVKKCVKKQCLTHQDYVDAVKLKKKKHDVYKQYLDHMSIVCLFKMKIK